MCVDHTNTRLEDVELVETLAGTMTESPLLANLLLGQMSVIKQGGSICMAVMPGEGAAAEGPERPPGIYPPN